MGDAKRLGMGEEMTDKPDELLRFFSRAERLERLPRTGWLVAGVQHPESVAAHGYEVALVALWLADNVDAEIDAEKVLRIALLHDIGEALLTDLPRPVKDFVGEEDVADAEARAREVVLGDVGPGWSEDAESYREQRTAEARIVKAADRIQMLAKSLVYDSQHRGDVERFWEGIEDAGDYGFPLVGRIFDRLEEHWNSGEWYANDLD